VIAVSGDLFGCIAESTSGDFFGCIAKSTNSLFRKASYNFLCAQRKVIGKTSINQ